MVLWALSSSIIYHSVSFCLFVCLFVCLSTHFSDGDANDARLSVEEVVHCLVMHNHQKQQESFAVNMQTCQVTNACQHTANSLL